MVNDILGTNIRKHRLARNWTQEMLADVLCVSHQVISKWENGIATPDITALCALAGIFNVSLDALCGIAQDQVDTIIGEMEKEMQQLGTKFESMYAKWKETEQLLSYHPTNDKFLFAALRFLRNAHDRIENDTQKETVNAEILKISERLLDFSRNDEYRSYANYNLAVYYDEQVNIYRNNEQDIVNAKKSKMYADLVLYKDMHKTFYHLFGAASLDEDRIALEKTLTEMVDATKGACKNLIRRYKHRLYDSNDKSKAYEDVLVLLNEIESVLVKNSV
ncbi:MAG: helix-turn-helix transcriptional regulator [Oscillospiraceae bacterium]|nr:helix-turn-helix transcriptional regulator [Oscillospiraceae bacterium]